MPVDSQIPLQVKQFQTQTPQQLMSLQDMATQSQSHQIDLQNKVRDQQNQNAILGILQNSGGQLNDQTLGAIAQYDPAKAIQLKHMALQTAEQDYNVGKQKADIGLQIHKSYLDAYDNALKSTGGNKDAAQAEANKTIYQQINQMRDSGQLSLFKPQEISQNLSKMYQQNPEEIRANTIAMQSGKPPEAPLGKLEADYKRGIISAKDYQAEKARMTSPTMMMMSTDPAMVSRIDKTAELIARGDMPPLSSFALKTPQGAQIMARVSELNPNYSAQSYKVKQDFTSGAAAKNVTAINTAIRHMGTLDDLNGALQNGNVQVVNATVNRVKTELGDPTINNAGTAQQAVANELMRVFRQVQASEIETKEWEQRFNSAKQSPAQMKGALRVGMNLLEGRLKELNSQYDRGMGTKGGFPDMISPDLRGVMDRVQGKTQGGNAPQAAIDYLKAHPETSDKFKAKFGYLP